ncbi:dihydrodipicolinate synthase family protein [Marinovum sp.]|uniref:dihydrodipicolinate synthase family protein n=1 Tax=Marinovum sp. TaxID=2024839 RepID=UPI002B26AA3E|nr:dihydrodipicolinate synthase family protein [Marinovum sp.]
MQGIIAAVPTPVNATGVPQKAPFLEHGRWALANGCDGLNVLGSTGEANSFDSATRKQVMGWAAKAFAPDSLMVGTGTPSLAETVALTRHADDLGYRVALVLPPYYYKPASDDGLFRWYEALHQALGACRIGIYFYNFPQMTGITLPPAVIARLRQTYPERFTGIKDSSGDLDYCRRLSADLPGFAVFPSSETSLAEAATAGFAGCISATVNQTAPLCARVWAARQAPDAALLDRIGALRGAIAGAPLIPAVKYLVGCRSGHADWAHTLPPFTPLTEAQTARLEQLDLPSPALAD